MNPALPGATNDSTAGASPAPAQAPAAPAQAPVPAAAGEPLRVVVIGGGPSPEHDVSLASARALTAGLIRAGHDARLLIAGRDGRFAAYDGQPTGITGAVRALDACDVAIPALHGQWGEDGTIAGFLEVLGVPYAGSGVEASAIAMNKDATKRILASHGLPLAAGICVPPGGATPDAGVPFPCIVKPTHAGSSIGITRVEDASGLPAAIAAAHATGSGALIEPVIVGREIDVALLELPDGEILAGPPLEIAVTNGAEFFDYAAKYDGGSRFDIPAPLTPALRAELERLAIASFRALGCEGLARVDFFVPDDGAPLVNEVNTFPGMTEHSQFPLIFAAAGYSFEQVADTLARTAVARAS